MEDDKTTFNEKNIEALTKSSFKNPKTKISSDAVKLFTELLRVHALEMLSRAAEQAKKEGSSQVLNEHIEKVLPQFLLDFS